jgi:K+-sensing histidine kinase KdpD
MGFVYIYCQIQVRLKQVALDHIDVAQAVADYINCSLIGNIVLGASGRNVLTRSLSQKIVLN